MEPSQFFHNAIESFLCLCRLRPHPAFTAKPLISFGMPVKTCTAASALHIFAKWFQRCRVGDGLAFSDLFCRFKLPCGDDLRIFRRTAVVCIGKDQSGQRRYSTPTPRCFSQCPHICQIFLRDGENDLVPQQGGGRMAAVEPFTDDGVIHLSLIHI